MITNNNEIIEVVPELESPEEIAINFFHNRDIELVENSIEDLKQILLSMVHDNARLQFKFNELYDEKWADTTLKNMKQELEQVKQDMHRGFPINKSDNEKINQWMKKHDTEIHNNPTQYHGCSGGGYEFSFIPTGLGTIGYCICGLCKNKAIREAGKDWWEHLKENKGFIEFGDFG